MTQFFWSEYCAGGWVLERDDSVWQRNALRYKGLSDSSCFMSRAISKSLTQQGIKLFKGCLTWKGQELKLRMWLLAAQLDLENYIAYEVWTTAVAIHWNPFEGLKRRLSSGIR